MLARRIIPCLDVRDGVVVKGVKFRNHEVIGDIVPLAERYAQEGADELVFYDITASSSDATCGRQKLGIPHRRGYRHSFLCGWRHQIGGRCADYPGNGC